MARDVFGVASAPFAALAPDGDLKVGFHLPTAGTFGEDLRSAAAKLAAEFVARQSPARSCAATDAACAHRVLLPYAELVSRRPLSAERSDRLRGLLAAGLGAGLPLDEVVRGAVEALVTSPESLYAGTHVPSTPGRHALDGHGLAERLALALWDSVPDRPLLDAAGRGELSTDVGLRRQVDRMLADPTKGKRFVNTFAHAYLRLRGLESRLQFGPKGLAAREWGLLLADMAEEARRFVQHVFESGATAQTLVTSSYSFLNARLARHYGVGGVAGDQLTKVDLPPESLRGGVLTQGAFLAQYQDVIYRGRAVNGSMLCLEIAAPNDPATVEAVNEQLLAAEDTDQLAAIRRDRPACAGCHGLMDPLGAALSAFDHFGARQQEEASRKILGSVGPYAGQRLESPAALRRTVVERGFGTCFVSHLLGAASHRILAVATEPGRCAATEVERLAGPNASMRDLLVASLSSSTFRSRVIGSVSGHSAQGVNQ
jgi:hypothetical protein